MITRTHGFYCISLCWLSCFYFLFILVLTSSNRPLSFSLSLVSLRYRPTLCVREYIRGCYRVPAPVSLVIYASDRSPSLFFFSNRCRSLPAHTHKGDLVCALHQLEKQDPECVDGANSVCSRALYDMQIY